MRAIVLPSLVLLLSACASEVESPDRGDRFRDPTVDVSPEEPVPSVTPIRGGGMTTFADGRMVAADVDADRLIVFDPAQATVQTIIELPEDSEPFRLEAVDGQVIASLRGSGAVASYDAGTGETLWSTAACEEPRGIEYDGADALYVACHSGHVVVLDAFTGEQLDRRQLGLYRNDLRDVVFDGQDLFITRFRTARVLRLDPVSLDVLDVFSAGDLNNQNFDLGPDERTLTPKVAWRAIQRPGGGVIVLHQRHETNPVPIERPGENMGQSAYGHSEPERSECAGILHTTWTEFDSSGTKTLGPVIKAPALATDFALSEQGELMLSSTAQPHDAGTGIVRTTDLQPTQNLDCHRGELHQTGAAGQVVAVQWSGIRRVVTTRMPFEILVDEVPIPVADPTAEPVDARQAAGWAMFHETTPSGLACASCHPEALDDGHVWTFEVADEIMPRRTPGFGGVVATTAPYHWNGEFTTFKDLLVDVLVGRMDHETANIQDASSLALWLDSVEPPKRDIGWLDAAAIERGRQLFEDPVIACANCHAGPQLTNNASVDIGTGGRFQVPTLIGVSGRGPWMHDGCATTLEQRFDPACGGDDHGATDLTEAEIADLVTYLRTL